MLTVYTELGPKNLIDGPLIHHLVKNISGSVRAASQEMSKMKSNHTVWLSSLAFRIQLGGMHVRNRVRSYNSLTYPLSDVWYSWRSPRYSPLGRTRRDLLIFFEWERDNVAKLREQSAHMLATLAPLVEKRRRMEEVVQAAQKEWDRRCMGKKRRFWLFGEEFDVVVGKEKVCKWSNIQGMRTISEGVRGMEGKFEVMERDVKVQWEAYERLGGHYEDLAKRLGDGEEKEVRFEKMNFWQYQAEFEAVAENMRVGSEALRAVMSRIRG